MKKTVIDIDIPTTTDTYPINTDNLPEGATWAVFWYAQDTYEGSGCGYAGSADGRFWTVNLGHCSCYGPIDGGEADWGPISRDQMLNMDLIGTDERTTLLRAKVMEQMELAHQGEGGGP